MSVAATHPNLLPSGVQSDIKHNLDSLVSQLCNIRLSTTQHQRLLLLRQRQLIEEDELRLKHYLEFEKLQKSMRQSPEIVHPQQPLLYIQPTTINQQGYINLTSGFMPSLTQNPQQPIQQQPLLNANMQASAMSAALQGYAVMLNPQLGMAQQANAALQSQIDQMQQHVQQQQHQQQVQVQQQHQRQQTIG